MPYAPARLVGPTSVPTSQTTMFTVPTSRTVQLRIVSFTNTTAGDITITLNMVPTGGVANTGNRVLSTITVAAHDIVIWTMQHVLAQGDVLSAVAGAVGLNMTVSGWMLS